MIFNLSYGSYTLTGVIGKQRSVYWGASSIASVLRFKPYYEFITHYTDCTLGDVVFKHLVDQDKISSLRMSLITHERLMELFKSSKLEYVKLIYVHLSTGSFFVTVVDSDAFAFLTVCSAQTPGALKFVEWLRLTRVKLNKNESASSYAYPVQTVDRPDRSPHAFSESGFRVNYSKSKWKATPSTDPPSTATEEASKSTDATSSPCSGRACVPASPMIFEPRSPTEPPPSATEEISAEPLSGYECEESFRTVSPQSPIEETHARSPASPESRGPSPFSPPSLLCTEVLNSSPTDSGRFPSPPMIPESDFNADAEDSSVSSCTQTTVHSLDGPHREFPSSLPFTVQEPLDSTLGNLETNETGLSLWLDAFPPTLIFTFAGNQSKVFRPS